MARSISLTDISDFTYVSPASRAWPLAVPYHTSERFSSQHCVWTLPVYTRQHVFPANSLLDTANTEKSQCFSVVGGGWGRLWWCNNVAFNSLLNRINTSDEVSQLASRNASFLLVEIVRKAFSTSGLLLRTAALHTSIGLMRPVCFAHQHQEIFLCGPSYS